MRSPSIVMFLLVPALSAGCAGSPPQAAGELERFRRAWSAGPYPPGDAPGCMPRPE